MKKMMSILLILLICMLTACGKGAKTDESSSGKDESSQQEQENEQRTTSSKMVAETRTLSRAENYEQILKLLEAADAHGYDYGGGYYVEDAVEEATEEEAMPDMPAEEAKDASNSSGEKEHSTTNVQVEGIDEGDIVKTDGNYIYVLHDYDTILIFKVEGEKVEQVAEMPLANATDEKNWWYSINDMYLCGDRLVLVSNIESMAYWTDGDSYKSVYGDREVTRMEIIDVSDRTAPQVLRAAEQDGWYSDSRLIDGTLYLVTNYYSYNYWDRSNADSYIPHYYVDGEKNLIEAEDILLPPESEVRDRQYTVLGVYDVNKAEIVQCQAVLGRTDDIYMNEKSLYLVRGSYEDVVTDRYTESVYDVEVHATGHVTTVNRFAVEDKKLKYMADGRVSGNIYGSFALDEKNGYLRIVTTGNSNTYKLYRDPKYGFENYQNSWWNDSSQTNNLFILDAQMQIVGKLTGLARGEQVYSVRYNGDIAYFCTFRQVDPLFAVDVSDPKAPKQLSALKIPGFSNYLHNYTDGRLFGLGKDADEITGRVRGLKLSMFDTSDPTNVTELNTAYPSGDYSEATYNHHAILIDAEKDLIGFPMDDGYVIYGYSDAQGFYEKAHIRMGVSYWDNARGLYIEDHFYIVLENEIDVIDLNSMEVVARVMY